MTLRVIEHKKTGAGYAELVTKIVNEVLRQRRVYGLGKIEEAQDVLAHFYPRISALILRYCGTGKSFEAYLSANLRYFRKEILCQDQERRMREREVLKRSHLAEYGDEEAQARERADSVAEAGPMAVDKSLVDARFVSNTRSVTDPGSEKDKLLSLCLKKNNVCSREATRLRVLLLGLKCAYHLNESQIERLAVLTGLHINCLRARIDALRDLAEPHFKKMEKLQARRDKMYASLCYYERLSYEEFDSAKKRQYEQIIERLRLRLQKCRSTISSIPGGPSNLQVGLVLGIPKGTVDSGLFLIRRSNAPLWEMGRGSYA